MGQVKREGIRSQDSTPSTLTTAVTSQLRLPRVNNMASKTPATLKRVAMASHQRGPLASEHPHIIRRGTKILKRMLMAPISANCSSLQTLYQCNIKTHMGPQVTKTVTRLLLSILLINKCLITTTTIMEALIQYNLLTRMTKINFRCHNKTEYFNTKAIVLYL